MAQGESPRNPLAFASVLYPGRCLAVELAVPQSEESSQMGALTRSGPRPGSPSLLLRAWLVSLGYGHILLVARPWWYFDF